MLSGGRQDDLTQHKQKNSNLHKAKKEKNDEFYTQYEDIEKEVNAYIDFNKDVFRDKVILCPCDDPDKSNFTKYFAQNFKRLGIKKLISTSYAKNSKSFPHDLLQSCIEKDSPLYDIMKTDIKGKIFTLEGDTNKDGSVNMFDLEFKGYLEGDGDFRSDEVKKLRDEADIIITNPPFSLFREFVDWIMEANKQFLIIGNMNAITYKEVFKYIKENKLWLGNNAVKQFIFAGTKEQCNKNITEIDGVLYADFGNVIWFTNLEHNKRHQPMHFMTMEENLRHNKKDLPNGYEKYDNYDAIEVPKVSLIPSDYDGVMGVPITYLGNHNPEEFEILGATQRGCHELVPDIKKYDDYKEILNSTNEKTGAPGGKTNENANLIGRGHGKTFFRNSEGREIYSCYQRLFIKKRNKK